MPNYRILIVDDEDDIRRIVRATLASKYEVVEAQDGLDALEKLDLAEPDFVVLDVMMPLMDGFQACAAIRRHPRFRDVPVLFLSALNKTDDMKKGYGAGANLYLTKPFEPARLLRNVDLFFETNPPPIRQKRYTLQELKALEVAGANALAQAHAQAEQKVGVAPSANPAAAPPPVDEGVPDAQGEQWWTDGKAVTRPSQSAASFARTALAGQASPAYRPSGPAKPRILFVDDDETILLMARGMLESDYELATAQDGLEAIEKVTALQPDIIVLDAMMPKMSGYQLCQSLRRNARFAKTPILFVSAKATPKERTYALRIGGTDFLAKPFDSHQLLQTLDAIRSAPDFKIQPKAVSILQLTEAENRRKKQLEEKQDRLHVKEETELERFLRENT